MSKQQKSVLLKKTTERPINRLKNETVKEKEQNEKVKIPSKSNPVPVNTRTKIPITNPTIPPKTTKPNPTKIIPKKIISKPVLRIIQKPSAKPVVPTPKISKNNVMNKVHNVTVSSPPSQRKEQPNLNRTRTLTRTLEPHEILVLNKTTDTLFGQSIDKDSLNSSEIKPIPIVKEPVAFEIKFEDEKSKNEEPEEDDEYESDFESYESDFETGSSAPEEEDDEDEEQSPTESESESTSTSSSPELTPPLNKDEERKLDSGNYELRIQREKQQMNSIDEGEINTDDRNDSGLGYSALLRNGSRLESNSKIINILSDTDIEESLREDRQVSRKNTRGDQLMKKITLDIMSFSLFELKPIPYDVYMKMYGNSNSSQNITQTNDDLMDQDTQTDNQSKNTMWTQFPPSFTKLGLIESMGRLYQQERIGVGEGDIIQISELTDLEKSLKGLQDNEIRTQNHHLTIDFERMNLILQKSSVTISNILDKKLKVRNLNKTTIPLSQGYFNLNTKQSVLELTKITNIYSNQNIPNLVLTVHVDTIGNSKDFDSLICVWNITDPKSPFKILSCWSSISCIEIHSDHPDVIIAGMTDGSLAIWDLKESSSWHLNDNSFRIPSQIIGHDLKDENLNNLGKIVSVKSLKNQSSLISEYNPSQICSLHEEGLISIWTILDTKISNFYSEQLNISPWSRIKLVKSTSIDLRQKFNNSKRRKSQFEKTRSYFENDIFSDDVLKELNGNSDVEKDSNQRNARMTDFEINSEGFYVGTNKNFIYFFPKSLKIGNSRKIIVDESNFLHPISLRLFSNQKILAVGLSDGSIKIFFCSTEKPEKIQESTPSTSTEKKSEEIENNLSAKSCAIQNIIKSERQNYKNSDSNEFKNKQVLLQGDVAEITITKLVNQQVIFGGTSIKRNFTKTIQIVRDDNFLFALIGSQLKMFNVLKNSELDFDEKLNDLKDIGLSDNGYGNKFLILLASDEVQIHRLH